MLVCMRVHGCWCVRVNMRGFVHYILTFKNIVVHCNDASDRHMHRQSRVRGRGPLHPQGVLQGLWALSLLPCVAVLRHHCERRQTEPDAARVRYLIELDILGVYVHQSFRCDLYIQYHC